MQNIHCEADFRKELVKIPSLHWTCIENHDIGAGTPDVIGCRNHYHFWFELKVEPSLRKSQYIWMSKYVEYSQSCWVLWLHEDILYAIPADQVVLRTLHLTSSVKKWMAASRRAFNNWSDFARWIMGENYE